MKSSQVNQLGPIVAKWNCSKLGQVHWEQVKNPEVLFMVKWKEKQLSFRLLLELIKLLVTQDAFSSHFLINLPSPFGIAYDEEKLLLGESLCACDFLSKFLYVSEAWLNKK